MFHLTRLKVEMTQHFSDDVTYSVQTTFRFKNVTLNMSKFELNISTNFLMQYYGQRQDKTNGTFSGQIGPQVPSGLILTV